MPKILRQVQPYKVDSIKDVKDFLIFAKNTLMTISKKSCFKQHSDSILIPTRWSKNKNCWVVDMCTDLERDIQGLTESNVDKFYSLDSPMRSAVCNILNAVNNNQDLYDIALKNHLVKNEAKMIVYMYTNNPDVACLIQPVGIFQLTKSKKRKGFESFKKNITISVNNSKSFVEKIVHTSSLINNLDYFCISNYSLLYAKFLEYVKIQKLEIVNNNVNVVFEFEKIIEDKFFKLDSTKNLSLIKKILNADVQREDIVYTNKSKIIKLYLSIYLSEFLKHHFNLSEKEHVVFWEKHMSNYVKLVGKEILEKKQESIEKKTVEIDYRLMMPRFL